MFKVVPDQLRVSQGWVRCGQCDEVFDANAHLRRLSQEPGVEPAIHAPAASSPTAHADELPPGPAQAPANYDWGNVLEKGAAGLANAPIADAFLEKSPQELIAGASNRTPVAPDLPETPPETALASEGAMQDALNEDPLSVPAAAEPVSFMLAKAAGSQKPTRMRGLWIVLLLVLFGVMVLQVVAHERDRLAAMQPSLKPALLALCEAVSCTVSPLKQIESIVIESSTFSKVQADVYKLSVTLKNNAALEVAKPLLELSLTNVQDEVLFRKVIAPVDAGDRAAVLGHGEDVTWTIPVSVKHANGAEKIAGYRLLVFYP